MLRKNIFYGVLAVILCLESVMAGKGRSRLGLTEEGSDFVPAPIQTIPCSVPPLSGSYSEIVSYHFNELSEEEKKSLIQGVLERALEKREKMIQRRK